MSIVTDFKSIRRKLERMEQKAEFEEKNPEPEPSMYGWPYGVAVPLTDPPLVIDPGHTHQWSNATLASLAHPEWPYTGTPHEWPKIKI